MRTNSPILPPVEASHDLLRVVLSPKFVLAPLPQQHRGGYRGKAQARSILGRRLQQWRTITLHDVVDSLKDQRARNVRQDFREEAVAEDMDVDTDKLP